jgi:hypothetical protein
MWVIALSVTIWLAWTAPKKNGSVVEISDRRLNETTATKNIIPDSNQALSDFQLSPRTAAIDVIANVFSAPTKIVQRAPVATTRTALPPPPLPFEFVGFVEEQNQTKVILENQGEVVAIKPGDSIGGLYRLISINKLGSNAQLKFLFIPKNLTQTMVVNNG